ncbi:MAG: KilA-N domain-containing protein, partial [Bacteroidales bacterium]
MKESIHTRNESLDERIETKSWLKRLANLLDWNLEKPDDKFKKLRNGLYKCRDYICLTDMVKDMEGEDHIRNWMRNRNTIEFLGTWEVINNPQFKGVGFDTFLHEAGANRFNMTPRKWIEGNRPKNDVCASLRPVLER